MSRGQSYAARCGDLGTDCVVCWIRGAFPLGIASDLTAPKVQAGRSLRPARPRDAWYSRISSPKMKYGSATPVLNFVKSSVLAAASGRMSESSLSANSID